MTRSTALFVALFLHSGFAFSAPAKPAIQVTPPLATLTSEEQKKVVHLLIKSSNVPLKPEKNRGCDTSSGRTVGEYFAFILSTLASADKTAKASLSVECNKTTPRACAVYVHVVDAAGESPWHYGLEFQTKKNGKEIDSGSFTCPGV